jgi:D-glycero-alpha-D-manno-heptose-7-phosphate kinase
MTKSNKSIKCTSPTRVDLAGGTLDMWPLYNFVGEAVTLNVAIDIWTTAEITENESDEVLISSPDLNKNWKFADYEDFKKSKDPALSFYKIIFNQFEHRLKEIRKGFSIVTTSQSPIGGGLGGSSSLTISILKALHGFLDLETPSTHDLVHLAHNIEAEMLRTPTGTQDYYPAVTGGLSFLEYGAREIKHEVLSTEGTPLEDHFLLVYTGKSHHSGLNNFEVLKSAVQGDVKVLAALKRIKDIADQLKAAILQKSWNLIPDLFQQEFAARIQLTPAFTSPEIEKLAEICLAAGALAVKICGAGGGGCVLVWVPPSQREKVVVACQKEKFQCLNAKPVRPLKLTPTAKK